MIDWHSFLQVNLLPLRSLRGPVTIPALSPAMIPVLQSGSSFTKERIDKVAPKKQKKIKKGTCNYFTLCTFWKTETVVVFRLQLLAAPSRQMLDHTSMLTATCLKLPAHGLKVL